MNDLIGLIAVLAVVMFVLYIVWDDGKRRTGAKRDDLEHPDGCVCESCEDRVWRRMIERAEADKRRREMQAAVDEMVRDTQAERR